MFDEGVLNEAMTLLEVEFMERLLYTPEQYQTKKTQRAALEAEMARLQAASNTSLDLLSQISNGSPQSSTAAPPESSSPP
jgi:biopolymer transport protein ExbB/TolQ